MSSLLSYKPRLDGLRFLAVAAVLLVHYVPSVGWKISSGFYGVNLFFVLSGFLITSILLQLPRQQTARQYLSFLGRRVLRIFPIYYLTLLALYLAGTPDIQERLPYLLSYTYNFVMPYVDWQQDYTVNFWSLCVEEQFYLFFPLLVLALRSRPVWLLVFCAGCFALAAGQVFFNIAGVDAAALRVFNYCSLLTNMAPLSLGAMGAVLARRERLPVFLRSLYAELAALLMIGLSLLYLPFRYQLICCTLANALLVLKAWQGGFSVDLLDGVVRHPLARYLGRISYGIYVYHFAVGRFLDDLVIRPLWASIDFSGWGALSWLQGHSGIFRLLSGTLVTIVLAGLSYQFIERPVLRLKDRLFPYRGRSDQELAGPGGPDGVVPAAQAAMPAAASLRSDQ